MNKNPKSKRQPPGKMANATEAQPDLIGNVGGARPVDAQWATALQFKPITGMDDQALRRLADVNHPNPATGTPWIPKPVGGKYEKDATLAGWGDYMRHQAKSADQRRESLSYESMDSCESGTGITKTLQRLAKSKGCSAFRGPRIYLLELVRWIFKEAASGNVADWGKMNVELDAKLKQVKLDTELRSLITRAEVEEFVKDLTAIFFGGIKRLEMECPRDLEMRSKEQIKARMAEKRRTICKQMTALLEKLKNESPKTSEEIPA